MIYPTGKALFCIATLLVLQASTQILSDNREYNTPWALGLWMNEVLADLDSEEDFTVDWKVASHLLSVLVFKEIRITDWAVWSTDNTLSIQ